MLRKLLLKLVKKSQALGFVLASLAEVESILPLMWMGKQGNFCRMAWRLL